MSALKKLDALQVELARLARILLESNERRMDELHLASEALMACTKVSAQLRAAISKEQP